MMFLLFVFAVLDESHLLLEILSECIIQFAGGNAVNNCLLRFLRHWFFFDVAKCLLILFHFGLADQHHLEFIYLLKVSHE